MPPVWRRASQVSGALLPHQPREGVEHAPVHEAGGSGSPPLRAARVAHTAVPPTAGAKRPRPAEEHTPGDARRRVSSPPPRFKAMAAPATVLSPGTVSPPAGHGPAARTPLSAPLATVGGAAQVHRLHAGITSPVPWPDLEGGGGRAAVVSPAAWASPYSAVAPASRPVGLTSPLCVLADAATDENKAPGHVHMGHGAHKHGLGMVPLAPVVVATVTKPRTSVSAGGFGASPRPMEKTNAAHHVMSPSPAALAAAAQCVRVRPAPHPQSAVPAVWLLGHHGGGPAAGFIRRSEGPVASAEMRPPPPHAGAGLSPALMNGFARLQQLRAHATDPPALAAA